MRSSLSTLLALGIVACLHQIHAQSIHIDPSRYQTDKNLKLIVCNQLPTSLTTAAVSIQLDRLYTFATPVNSFRTGQFYAVIYNDTTYRLSFTRFPIVGINTKGVDIVQNIPIQAKLTLSDTNGVVPDSYIGINIRGGSSATFPKKSYKIQFWTDTISHTPKDTTLFGMRSDSDWLLLAMYNEALRINNVTSYKLWQALQPVYYLDQEPDALSAIRTRYVNVFLNGSFTGIYALGEQIDRKELKLKKTKDNGQVRGELYKSFDWTDATVFSSLPAANGTDTTWAGFELKYPNQPGFWANLYGLVGFVVNSTNDTFKSQVASKWQIDNLVDYFLFLNLVRATDNRGKNIYIARYKENEPYFFAPWDLDGTWGSIYTGDADNTTNDILTFGLYDRLLALNPGNFKQKLKTRWFSLRSSLFAASTLKNNLAANAGLLTADGAYLREATKWSISSVNADLAYRNTWIDNRVAYLDSYFGQIPDDCTNPAAPTVSMSTSLITAGQSTTLTASGCPYTVVWNTGEMGPNLLVSPWETTHYWAVCNQVGAGCESPASQTLVLQVMPEMAAEQADLSLHMQSGSRLVPVTTTTRLTLTVTNNGPVTAHAIRLQDRLPSGLVFAGSTDPNVTHLSGILATASDVINITVDSLGNEQTASFSFDVRPTISGLFRNAAQILQTSTYDPDSHPGSGTGDGEDDMEFIDIRTLNNGTTVLESPNPNQRPLAAVLSDQPIADSATADLSLRMQLDRRSVKTAETVTVLMVVHNTGGLTANGVTVQCTLPSGVQFVGGDGVSVSGRTLTVPNLTIPAGDDKSILFQVQVTGSGTWICQGQVYASQQTDPDSTPGNGTTNGEDDEAQVDLRVK